MSLIDAIGPVVNWAAAPLEVDGEFVPRGWLGHHLRRGVLTGCTFVLEVYVRITGRTG